MSLADCEPLIHAQISASRRNLTELLPFSTGCGYLSTLIVSSLVSSHNADRNFVTLLSILIRRGDPGTASWVLFLSMSSLFKKVTYSERNLSKRLVLYGLFCLKVQSYPSLMVSRVKGAKTHQMDSFPRRSEALDARLNLVQGIG